jgi:hypothetical protein
MMDWMMDKHNITTTTKEVLPFSFVNRHFINPVPVRFFLARQLDSV